MLAFVERLDLVLREGTTEQEALTVTAAVLDEEPALILGLDSLGKGLEAERLC